MPPKRLWQKLRADYLLHFLILLCVALNLYQPLPPKRIIQAIDWQTIAILTGLLILTKGIELSGCLESTGHTLVRRFRSQRRLAYFMTLAAALLSTFLTNDVALFICVPLALSLKKYPQIAVNRLIIFQALAVNAGSLLTPQGNPQNILIWQQSGLPFLTFIAQMAPLAAILTLILLILCKYSFPSAPIQLPPASPAPWRHQLLWLCLALYALFLLTINRHQPHIGVLIILPTLALLAPKTLTKVDWSLLIIFALMFIDTHLIAQLPALQPKLSALARQTPVHQYLTAIGLSQLISNVPASMILLNTLPASQPLAFAVNIGGFGLLQGSLANIIALRMAQSRSIYWQFHAYSLPLLLLAALIGYAFLALCHLI